jgi:hypothetical protein
MEATREELVEAAMNVIYESIAVNRLISILEEASVRVRCDKAVVGRLWKTHGSTRRSEGQVSLGVSSDHGFIRASGGKVMAKSTKVPFTFE